MPEQSPQRAHLYEGYAGDPGAAHYGQQLARMAELFDATYGPFLPASRHARVLDVGCGAGHLIGWLRQRGYDNVLGVDHSANQIAVARQYQDPSTVLQIDDLSAWLSGQTGQWDAITLNQVIEHFSKTEVMVYLKLLSGVLKPGGCLLLQTPNMCAFGGLRHRYHDFTHEVGFTEVSLAQVLSLSGMERVQVLPVHMPVRGSIKRLAFRSLQRLQEKWLAMGYFVAMGTDRPRVVSGDLLGVAYRP